MSTTKPSSLNPVFAQTATALGSPMEPFLFAHFPAQRADQLESRVKLAAKLLRKTAGIPHSRALDAVAQALRFPAWHHLSAHLDRAADFEPESLPPGWLEALAGAIVLTIEPADDVALPKALLEAFEHFGKRLADLTGSPEQVVLDGVSAGLCGERTWAQVHERNPLKTVEPLYGFKIHEIDMEGNVDGRFVRSPACAQLARELDDRLDTSDPLGRRRARTWVESVLLCQPGFLEGGLALAEMHREVGPKEALRTATRFVRAAEALIPEGFKGRIIWGELENRFYHLLLWLQVSLHNELNADGAATKVARKMLQLNPSDNLGVREVLPLLLLAQGQTSAAKRSLGAIKNESGLTASAIRAFVAFAEGNTGTFRHQLATAVFTLPILRGFLLNDFDALPAGESGFRGVQPDMETFFDFAWPSYCDVPGLREACCAFLAEPVVLEAEQTLASYWNAYRGAPRGTEGVGDYDGWKQLQADCIDRVAPAVTTKRRRDS